MPDQQDDGRILFNESDVRAFITIQSIPMSGEIRIPNRLLSLALRPRTSKPCAYLPRPSYKATEAK
jgi:hypothetical protein